MTFGRHEPAAGSRQVRVVERWGIVAGVTGVTGNVLLIALFAVGLPATSEYAWTGPANDVIGGIVAAGATVPVVFALGELVDGGGLLRRATVLAAAALTATAVSSALLVGQVISFEQQVVVAIPAIVVLYGWLTVLGRAGLRTRSLPSSLARAAVALGLGGVLGLLVAGASLLLPTGSPLQYAVGGLGLLAGVPAYLAFPTWLIAVSSRLRDHLTGAHDAGSPVATTLPGRAR